MMMCTIGHDDDEILMMMSDDEAITMRSRFDDNKQPKPMMMNDRSR